MFPMMITRIGSSCLRSLSTTEVLLLRNSGASRWLLRNQPAGAAITLINKSYESSSSVKKVGFQIKTARSAELLQDAIEQKKRMWAEKRENLQKRKEKLRDDIKVNIQEKRERVKEVRERVEGMIEKENIFTIPNLLCVARMAMSPYLGYVIINGDFALGMGILTVAGITDLLDGYIARNWPSQASRAGSFLDPMADKILMGCLVVSLTYTNMFPLWLTGVIVSRDVLLILTGFVIRYKSLPPPITLSRYFDATYATAQLSPTFISKVNTAVQLVAVAASLGAPVWNYVDHPHLHYLWYFTGATTVAAALSYILTKNTYKLFNNRKKTPM